MPTPMAEFAADLEERVSGIASYRIIPFLEASTEELRKGGAPYLEGLQPASSQAKLAELLECVGRKVGVFFEVCPNTTAIETLRRSQFRKSGEVRLSRLETFEYMMAVTSFEGQPSVEEYRSDGAGNLRHQGGAPGRVHGHERVSRQPDRAPSALSAFDGLPLPGYGG